MVLVVSAEPDPLLSREFCLLNIMLLKSLSGIEMSLASLSLMTEELEDWSIGMTSLRHLDFTGWPLISTSWSLTSK